MDQSDIHFENFSEPALTARWFLSALVVCCLFAAFFSCLVSLGLVFLSASSVALGAGRYKVLYVVCAATVVFYEVVCLGGWDGFA